MQKENEEAIFIKIISTETKHKNSLKGSVSPATACQHYYTPNTVVNVLKFRTIFFLAHLSKAQDELL